MSVPLSPHAVAPDVGSWRAEAACQLGDHELFFPPEEEQGEYFRLRVSLAKRPAHGARCSPLFHTP